MSNLILSDKHTPCGYGEILGCSGYGEVKNKNANLLSIIKIDIAYSIFHML